MWSHTCRKALRESERMKKSLVPVPVRTCAAALMLSCQLAAGASAQSVAQAASEVSAKSAEEISVQLNDAETVNGSCRLTFVIRNSLQKPVNALVLIW